VSNVWKNDKARNKKFDSWFKPGTGASGTCTTFHSQTFLTYWSDEKLTRDMIDTRTVLKPIPYHNTACGFDITQERHERYIQGKAGRAPLTCILVGSSLDNRYEIEQSFIAPCK
jgi:hypothetical protein